MFTVLTNMSMFPNSLIVQSNLCTTSTPGTTKILSLSTDGHCSEIPFYYTYGKRDHKIVVVVNTGGHYLEVCLYC